VNERRRPYARNRKFRSSAVDSYIEKYRPKFKNENIGTLFNNALPNCLDSTVTFNSTAPYDSFIVTGDMDSMWIRDAVNQVVPYFQFLSQDDGLKNLVCGLIHRIQHQILNVNVYANAFHINNTSCHQREVTYTYISGSGEIINQTDKGSDIQCSTGEISDTKFELDSLPAFLKLSYHYYIETKDPTCLNPKWLNAVKLVINTFKAQQKGTFEELKDPAYTYHSIDSNIVNILPENGRGPPSIRTGMVKSGFRPSDDACTFPFHVPDNMMIHVELGHLVDLLGSLKIRDDDLNSNIQKLRQDIEGAIEKFGLVNDLSGNKYYAYEVDGFGSHVFMDDANIPSLLSLPYIGYLYKTDPIYLRTRNRVLSELNPYFFKGKYGEGTGSNMVGSDVGYNYIWHISVLVRALTSNDDAEIAQCLETISTTCGPTGFIHESFYKDDFNNYTRAWFAWANSLFGELMVTLIRERPHLLFKEFEM